MKRITAIVLAITMLCALLCSCNDNNDNKEPEKNKLDLEKQVTLTVCGPWAESKAVETASQAFYEKYPNCEIKYEYVQNYEENLTKRLENSSDTVDLFLTENIQDTSSVFPYAEDLYSHKELDLSNTNEALVKNFQFITTDKTAEAKLYSIPFGGELRGMYVNKTLLKSVGLEVPTNVEEFLNACEVLKKAGYIPVQGNPGMLGQRLLYPYVCSLIANSDNYTELYDKINNCEEGIGELFRKPLELMYTLTANYYYNYKYVETEYNMFTDNSDEACARYFFNVLADGDGFTKKDDIGTIAFMPGIFSQKTTNDKVKDDYHSTIDYDFIMSPVGEDGGFAYISPSKGIAVNKNTANMDWAIEFLNFLFTEENNTRFAEDSNCIPNTKNSFDVIKEEFDVPENRICDLGQMTFDYKFYNFIENSLIEISKANNPKYMNTDESGNSVMYDFEYYMQNLENAFAEQRNGEAKTK